MLIIRLSFYREGKLKNTIGLLFYFIHFLLIIDDRNTCVLVYMCMCVHVCACVCMCMCARVCLRVCLLTMLVSVHVE